MLHAAQGPDGHMGPRNQAVSDMVTTPDKDR